MTQTDQLLQTLLEVVVTVAAPILASLLGMFLRALYKRVVDQMSEQQYQFAADIIRELVKAAEQLGLAGQLEKLGAEKKAWVIQMAEEILAKRGIHLDLAIIEMILEAAVLDEFNWAKQKSQATDEIEDASDVSKLN